MQSNKKHLILSTPKSPMALAIVAAIAGLGAQPVFAFGDGAMCTPASTFTVTSNLGDSSVGTLTAAIILANADADCSQIEFASDVTSINLDATTTISEDLNIVGHGRDSLNLTSATGDTLHAHSGNLHVSHLTVSGSSSAGIYQKYAHLTVDDVLLDKNGYGIKADNALDTVVRNSTITNSVYDSGINLFNDATGSTLLIDKSDISNNQSSGGGGGLYASVGSSTEIKISESTFSGNTTFGNGGAINIRAFGDTSVTIEETSIIGNSSGNHGGGISITNNYTGTEVSIDRSTIAGNTGDNDGGGLYVTNSGSASGNFSISQSTLSGNTAASSRGGAIYFDDSSTSPGTLLNLLVDSSTIVKNIASYNGGGIYHFGSNDVIHIQNTVIAQNTANSGYMNLSGVFNSLEHSWVGDNNGDLNATTDPTYTNSPVQSVIDGDESSLKISDLADNGGPTHTHVPQVGSPLLEMGNPATVDLSATDQRGLAREVGLLDIGSVERMTEVAMNIALATGALTVDFGQAFSIDLSTITSSNGATISVSGLPNGLSFNTDTNIISGTATETGANKITVSITNFDSSTNDTIDLYVTMNAPSLDTSSINTALNIMAGQSISIDISNITSDENVILTVTGLPEGLSFDPTTNLITGEASQSGTFELTITAQNTDKEASVIVELVAQGNSSSSGGAGSFGYGLLLILAGLFRRKR
ncbi:MAG: putative Ig domain-containing protein [Oleispira sp.]